MPFSRLLKHIYNVINLANDVLEYNNSFHFTLTYGDTGVICIIQLIDIYNSQTVVSNTNWPQFEIINEDEPEVDTMSEDGGYATALASVGHVDEGFNSLLDSFEVWVLFLTVCQVYESMTGFKWFFLMFVNRQMQTKKVGPLFRSEFQGSLSKF